MMTDYKSLAERIRQTLAEGGNCELTTEEWRAVADLLEREPCEDAISRQAAIHIASGYCHPANIAAELSKLPPTQPETAHWIMPKNDDGMSDPIEYQVRCSKCGFDLDPQTWHMELHKHGGDKYCPKCGKKMEVEQWKKRKLKEMEGERG